jgi:hypothetical protein
MKINSINFKLLQLFLLYSLISLLAACTSIEQTATEANLESRPEFPNIFSARPEMAALNDIHQLSTEQENEFLTYFNDPANQLTS